LTQKKLSNEKPVKASVGMACLAGRNFKAGRTSIPFYFVSFSLLSRHRLFYFPNSPAFVGTFCEYQFVSQPAGGTRTNARIEWTKQTVSN
jgi:hypothetical protein